MPAGRRRGGAYRGGRDVLTSGEWRRMATERVRVRVCLGPWAAAAAEAVRPQAPLLGTMCFESCKVAAARSWRVTARSSQLELCSRRETRRF